MPEQDNCPHNNIENNMCPLHCTDCGKVLEQDNWKEELKKLLDNQRTGLKDSSDTNKTRYAILALFEDSLSSQAHALKEKMKVVILEKKRELIDGQEGDVYGVDVVLVEDIVSAIESIEI